MTVQQNEVLECIARRSEGFPKIESPFAGKDGLIYWTDGRIMVRTKQTVPHAATFSSDRINPREVFDEAQIADCVFAVPMPDFEPVAFNTPNACTICNGSKKKKCRTCGGDGQHSCMECDDQHECNHCDGEGEVDCDCNEGNEYPDNDSADTIRFQRFSISRFYLSITKAMSGQLYVKKDHVSEEPIYFDAGEYEGLVCGCKHE